ncbi:MAG: TVP38/TMEM64 family protein [Promethearchaeota archaeon]
MGVNDTEKEQDSKKPFKVKLRNYIKNLFDLSQLDKKTILYIIIFLILIGLSLFLLIYNYFIDDTFIYTIVAKFFVNPVSDLGIIGIFLFILIMAVQGLIVPIPSEVVLLATGMIWGWLLGGIFGVIGSMAAALLCFYVSKKGGRPLAKKFVGERAIDLADNLIQKYGIKAIIVSRLIPFIPFDLISYASGLVDIDVKRYSIGTLIGSVFRAFFYSVWGFLLFGGTELPIDFSDVAKLEAQAGVFNWILLIVLGLLVLMFIAYFFTARYFGKKRLEENSTEQ